MKAELFLKKYRRLNDAIYRINLDDAGGLTCRFRLDDVIFRLAGENTDIPTEEEKAEIKKKAK